MKFKFGLSLLPGHLPRAPLVLGDWLLATGFWVDTDDWVDTEFWID